MSNGSTKLNFRHRSFPSLPGTCTEEYSALTEYIPVLVLVQELPYFYVEQVQVPLVYLILKPERKIKPHVFMYTCTVSKYIVQYIHT